MKILMTNNTLADRGGSELYIRDLAVQLRNRGHSVITYSTILGDVAEEIRSLGIPVVNDLNALTEVPDIIHGHHHLDSAAAALHFPRTPLVYACHGWLPWQEMPLTYPLADRYVAVSKLTQQSLVTSGIPSDLITLISNFVDVQRFQMKRQRPLVPIRRALAYGNPWHTENSALKVIRDCCKDRGIEFEVIGLGAKNSTNNPEGILPNFDVVFAVGRSALEALACGCAVIIAHPSGFGGSISTNNLAEQRNSNFGLASYAGRQVTRKAVSNALDSINTVDAEQVSLIVRETMCLEIAVSQWEELYYSTISHGTHRMQSAIAATSKYLVNFKKYIYRIERDTRTCHERNQLLENQITQCHERNQLLENQIAQCHERNQLLESKLSNIQESVRLIMNTFSWRITKPLREVRSFFAKL